jgi:hypothetical protein
MAYAETLTNDTILSLKAADLSDEIIIAKIKGADAKFDTSTEAILFLKNKGVSSPVIAAMLEQAAEGRKAKQQELSLTSPDPMVPHPAGLYILHQTPAPRMQRIDPTVSSQSKTGGIFGYALTGGIASMSVKVAIANSNASTVAENQRPTFYFFFDESNAANGVSFSQWTGGAMATAASPNEFSLVELMQKKERREARVGSVNLAGAKTGVMDKDRISFTSEIVRQGVYRVQLPENLPAGEYAFLQAVAGAAGAGAASARIFDFRVK